MKLVYKKTGEEVLIGQKVTLSRGEKVKIVGILPPRHAASSGHVVVMTGKDATLAHTYYVSVIGAEFIERDDR